jgi:tRNA (mo5U34)-methyltransferase
MEGMAALDVGTADGFFAFEMERRGAERVVATDVASLGDWDLVPRIQSRLSAADQSAEHAAVGRFRLAHAMLSSEVEHRLIGVYEVSPETVGRFDVVFCGSLLLHVRDPLRALCAIRSVTAGMAVIETSVEPRVARERPRIPALRFGARELEEDLGANAQHWQFTTRGLQEMLSAAGFARSEPRGVFQLPPTELAATVVVAYASQSPSRARMVGRRLTRPARSLAGRLHRRALRNAAMGW